jgi:regulator of protease activity HflC (stomatin/prohibitin superfamily)
MKYVVVFFVVLTLLLYTSGCTLVPAGEVGVRVNLYGDDRGVQPEVVGPGRYFVTPWQSIYTFPTFTQNSVWLKEDTYESPGDESFVFNSVEGMTVDADVGISYHIDPKKVADVFQKYRRGIDEITRLYVRNMVRDEIVRIGSTLKIEEIYGNGKIGMMNEVQKSVAEQLAPIGIIIEKIYWIGSIRLPTQVIEALNSKIAAIQQAQQRENEVATATAEAQKQIEQAKGLAEATRINAEAQATANKILAQSLTPELVRYRAIDKWDGKLPTTALSDSATALVSAGK